MRRAALAMVVLLGTSGCFVSYTPPIRGLGAGMPDRVSRGELEVGGTVGTWSQWGYPTTGGPHFSFPISEGLTVEGGSNQNFVEGLWATGWAGVRLIRTRELGNGFRLSGDFETGWGLGVGGRAAVRWYNQGVLGVYDGLGLGLRYRWVGAFARARVDGTVGTHAPSTLWPSLVGGLEATLFQRVVVSAGAGTMGYWNTADGLRMTGLFQLAVAVLFDLTR